MRLTFYYDVACPYAYLAFCGVGDLAERAGADLEYVPVLLGGLFRATGGVDDPNTVMSPSRARMNLLDLARAAAEKGIPLQLPPNHPRRSVQAMRLLVGVTDPKTRIALTAALYEAYFVHGRDISDRAVLDEIARAHGVEPAIIDSPEARAGLFATTDRAAKAGAFGVPTFQVGGRIFWGQDRMPLVEAALHAAAAPVKVRFFHDFSSPYSYLGSTGIAGLCARHGAELEYAPMLLGALFKDIGTANVPMATFSPARQAYTRQDLDDWSAVRGVKLRFPSRFPIRSVLPLRVAIGAPETTDTLYRAAWVQDLDIADPRQLAQVLDASGFDGARLVEAASDPAIKLKLRENTAEAVALGACGAPSFQVIGPDGDSALYWGQDRLNQVAAAIDAARKRTR